MRQYWRSGAGLSSPVPLFVILLLATGLTPSFVGAAGPKGQAGPPAETILLITIDGARADLAARERELPQLFAVAHEGVSFENATTPSALTFPATVSLMTGLYPHHSLVEDEFRVPLDPGSATLATRLAAGGWKTAGFPADYLSHERSGVEAGFDSYLAGSPGLSDSARVDSVTAFFRRNSGARAFAWTGFTTAVEHPLWERYLGSEAADSAAYLARAREIDVQIGRLRDGLRDLGLLPRTIFIVIGTHGETVPGWPLASAAGAEAPLPGHGLDLSEDALRVPWVISLPEGAASPTRILTVADGWVSTIDLLPTTLELAGIDPVTSGDGVSLAAAMGGAGLPSRILFHEADLRRTLGWSLRLAARGRSGKLLLYGGRTALRPLGPGTARDGAGEASRLLAALASEYRLSPKEIPPPVDRDTLFADENEQIRLLLDVRPTENRVNPRAAALLADYTQRYPQNVLFQVEQSLGDISARREQQAAVRLDAILDARPELVELQGLYAEHLIFFGRYDVLIGRFESLSGQPMFEADRLWRLGAAQVAAGQAGDAMRTFALAGEISAPPGRRWEQFKDVAPNIDALRSEIKIYPDHYNSYLRLGRHLWSLGLLDQAYAQFQQARARAPVLAEPEYELGHYLALEGRPKNAAGAFLRAVEKDPKHLPSRIELAYAQIQTGETDAAISNLREAVSIGEVDGQVHYNLACLLAQKGERDESLRELSAALGKGYSNRALIERDPDLDPLREDPRFRELLNRLSR